MISLARLASRVVRAPAPSPFSAICAVTARSLFAQRSKCLMRVAASDSERRLHPAPSGAGGVARPSGRRRGGYRSWPARPRPRALQRPRLRGTRRSPRRGAPAGRHRRGTPPNSHADYCLRAFAAGAHVICEKPFVSSLAEAEDVLDAARRAGRRVANDESRDAHLPGTLVTPFRPATRATSPSRRVGS